MSWHYFLLGGVLGLAGTLLAVRVFPQVGLLDFPERYNLTRKKIAYPGGLVLSFLSLFLAFFDERLVVPAILAGLLLILSFIDDRKPIKASIRFLFQLCIIGMLMASGVFIQFIGDPFNSTNFSLLPYPLLSFGLTAIWLLFIQNAMNFLDGIKGVSVGVSGLGFLTLGLLSLIKPELFLDPTHISFPFASLYLAGLCFGAYYFYSSGKIILGDSGSQVLGFWLGVLSLISGAKVATTLLVLGLPLIDAFITILRRIIIDKKAPWHGDSLHLHHLLAFRYSEATARHIIITFSLLFGLVALFLTPIQKLIAIIFLFIVIVALWASAYRFFLHSEASNHPQTKKR